jgi:hypothetical protein
MEGYVKDGNNWVPVQDRGTFVGQVVLGEHMAKDIDGKVISSDSMGALYQRKNGTRNIGISHNENGNADGIIYQNVYENIMCQM